MSRLKPPQIPEIFLSFEEQQALANQRGPKGDTGARGSDGTSGSAGSKGDTGAKGASGASGVAASLNINVTPHIDFTRREITIMNAPDSNSTLLVPNKNYDTINSKALFPGNGKSLIYTLGVNKPSVYVAGGSSSKDTLAYSADGLKWSGLGNLIFSNECYTVCWNGSIWIAGGSGVNTMAYSSDGIIWTGLGTTIFSTRCNKIIYNGSVHIACGFGGNCLAKSNDGINWTAISVPTFNELRDITWNGSIFLATGTGSSGQSFLYSAVDNLNTWTAVTWLSFEGYGVAWSGSVFVAVGNEPTSTINYSTDGINWSATDTSIFTFGRKIAWNGKTFVAVGAGTYTLAYSANGFDWTGINSHLASGGLSVLWTGDYWIAGGVTGGLSASMDPYGKGWTDTPSPFDNNFSAVEYSNIGNIQIAFKKMIFFGGFGTSSTLAYSYDGINITSLGTSLFNAVCISVMWNGNIWIATGGVNNTIAYSYDGINWTGLGTSIFNGTGSLGYYSCWNGKMFVIGGGGGSSSNTLGYSYDGINWIGAGNTVINNFVTSIAWNGTIWVAVGLGTVNTIAYSHDGINWTGAGKSIISTGSSVVWTGTAFIAGDGNSSTPNSFGRSVDGINWVAITNSVFNSVTGVAYNRGKLVATGGPITDSIAYSLDDGLTWTGVTGTTIFLSGQATFVGWVGDRFIANGSPNKYAYSFDGINWLVANSPIDQGLNAASNLDSNGYIKRTVKTNISLKPYDTLTFTAPEVYDKSLSKVAITMTQNTSA